jgi:hypothetical protein
MKVLNLRCANGHGFEGWFDNEDDFLAQNGAQRIECPLCEDRVIVKMPSAPRLNLSKSEPASAASALVTNDEVARPGHPMGPLQASNVPEGANPEAMQALWMQAVKHVMANTEDVGRKFADEARKIHYGEAKQRGIRGEATPQERAALLDEGIEVAALPMPAALKGPLQ